MFHADRARTEQLQGVDIDVMAEVAASCLELVVPRQPVRRILISLPGDLRCSVNALARWARVSSTAWVKWALANAERDACVSLSGGSLPSVDDAPASVLGS